MRANTSEAPAPGRTSGCGWVLLLGCGVTLLGALVCGGFLGLLHHQAQVAEPSVNAFSHELAGHDYAAAYASASPSLREASSLAEFSAAAQRIEAQFGAIQSRGLQGIGVHSAAAGHKLVTVRYLATYERGQAQLTVTLDDATGELRVRTWRVELPEPSQGYLSLGEARAASEPPSSESPAPSLAPAEATPAPSAPDEAGAQEAAPEPSPASPSPTPSDEPPHESQ